MSSLAQHLAQLEASGLISLQKVEPEQQNSFQHRLIKESSNGTILKI